ncbi:MAG TPA: CBS domain-containing protein [Acidimicrobiales bacterium]
MKTLQEVMSQPALVVKVNEVVGPVRDLMLDHEVHGVPVVDDDGTLVGIVTGSDLVEEWQPQQGIATVMSDQVRTASPFTSVVDAARTMLEHRIHHLVIVQGDEVVGMVSSFDLLHVLAGDVEAASSLAAPGRPTAQPGDVVVIRGHAIDQRERRGVITGVRGPDGGPPFVVQWLDDPNEEPHDVLFFPGSDADIEPAVDPAEG